AVPPHVLDPIPPEAQEDHVGSAQGLPGHGWNAGTSVATPFLEASWTRADAPSRPAGRQWLKSWACRVSSCRCRSCCTPSKHCSFADRLVFPSQMLPCTVCEAILASRFRSKFAGLVQS